MIADRKPYSAGCRDGTISDDCDDPENVNREIYKMIRISKIMQRINNE